MRRAGPAHSRCYRSVTQTTVSVSARRTTNVEGHEVGGQAGSQHRGGAATGSGPALQPLERRPAGLGIPHQHLAVQYQAGRELLRGRDETGEPVLDQGAAAGLEQHPAASSDGMKTSTRWPSFSPLDGVSRDTVGVHSVPVPHGGTSAPHTVEHYVLAFRLPCPSGSGMAGHPAALEAARMSCSLCKNRSLAEGPYRRPRAIAERLDHLGRNFQSPHGLGRFDEGAKLHDVLLYSA